MSATTPYIDLYKTHSCPNAYIDNYVHIWTHGLKQEYLNSSIRDTTCTMAYVSPLPELMLNSH